MIVRCKQCRAEEGTHHKMSCSAPGGGKHHGECFKMGFPRQMLFACRWCSTSEWVTQKEGDEFPPAWQHLGDGPPLCPECAEEWNSRPEDER